VCVCVCVCVDVGVCVRVRMSRNSLDGTYFVLRSGAQWLAADRLRFVHRTPCTGSRNHELRAGSERR
jgi:hypothetical protein